jgi:hypothetical protein
MLATIGKNLQGLSEQNSAQLPSAWNTLYFLSLLGLPRLLKYIDAGTVHPGLTLRDARERWRKLTGSSPSTQARLTRLRRRFKAFARFLRTSLREWPAEERGHDVSGLTLLSQDLRNLGADVAHTITTAARQQQAILPLQGGRGEGERDAANQSGRKNVTSSTDTASGFPPAIRAMVGMARRAVPARVVAGGTNNSTTLPTEGAAPTITR